jgi:hypothetical protein
MNIKILSVEPNQVKVQVSDLYHNSIFAVPPNKFQEFKQKATTCRSISQLRKEA